MEGEKAMEIFNIVKKNKLLPATIDELLPLSFIGSTAVTFYREKVKLMDRMNATMAQKQATLKDGQDAGELLLEIETRIGQIAMKEKGAKAKAISVKGPTGRPTVKSLPSGKPPKHERLGMKKHQKKNVC